MQPSDNDFYRLGLFYYNPADKRTLVLKRAGGFGWTFNFAKWWTWLIMAMLLGTVIWAVTRL